MKMLVACPRGRTFNSFFTPENLKLAKSLGRVIFNPYARNMTQNETFEMLKNCDVYVSSWGTAKLSEEMLENLPRLKAVVHLGGSPLPFVCEKAWRKGICVISGENFYVTSAAEGTLAYILADLRDIPEYSFRLKKEGEWKHSWDRNRGLVGKTLGFINYDPVAEALAKIVSGFGVKILACDAKKIPLSSCSKYNVTQVSENDVFGCADIISVHTPRSAKRYHTIGLNQLSLMKKGSLLVDTSVGGLLDYGALASVLVTGRISAIIDLPESELWRRENSVFCMPNVMLMPHMAGPSSDMRAVVARELLTECAEYLKNGVRPPHQISLYRAKRRTRWDD